MTRKEWIEKNLPAYINENADGGVIGCPNWYRELTRMDPGILVDWPCKTCHEESPLHMCEECWNMELNIKEEREITMTRREFVEKNHPQAIGGVHAKLISGCPGMFKDLVALDPSCGSMYYGRCRGSMYYGRCRCKATMAMCEECWNTPIPQQPNDEVPMPVVGGRFWTFVPMNISQNADLFVMGNFVITALMKVDTEIRVVARDEISNQICIFFYNPEKKCIRKLPSDGILEQKYPEIDFTIYWDEESMNKAKRGIVTDREYTNQYILLTKADNKKGE